MLVVFGVLLLPLCRGLSPASSVARSVERAQASVADAVAVQSMSDADSPVFSLARLDPLKFRLALKARRHAVLRVEEELGLSEDLKALKATALVDLFGGAREVRTKEYVGAFADHKAIFVEMRFANGTLVPRNDLDHIGLSLLCIAESCLRAVDPSLVALADVAPTDDDDLSASVLRLCRYEPIDTEMAFAAHTDTTFFTMVPVSTVPGLQIFDPSLRAWLKPEEDQQSGNNIVVMAGEFLDLFSDGAFQPAVHRVLCPASSSPRYSTPLLLRANRRQTWRNRTMPHLWRALQSSDPQQAYNLILQGEQ